MKETPRPRQGARHASVWGLLASLALLSPSAVRAAVGFSGNFDAPLGAVYDGGDQDRAAALALDASTNVYVVGKTSAGINSFDWLLVKYSSVGVALTSATLNSAGNGDDQPNAIAVCGADIYVGGSLDRNTGNFKRQLNKYNASWALLASTVTGSVMGGEYTGVACQPGGGVYAVSVRTSDNSLRVDRFDAGLTVQSSYNAGTTYSNSAGTLHNIALDGSGNVYAAAFETSTRKLVVSKFDSLLVFQASAAFSGSPAYIGGVTLGVNANGVYATVLSTVSGTATTVLYRLNTSLVMQSSVAFAGSGTGFPGDERTLSFNPANGDVYVSGSGPFPGLWRCTPSLACTQVNSPEIPTNSLAVLSSTRVIATRVNMSSDIEVRAFDPTASQGGGDSGGKAIAIDLSGNYWEVVIEGETVFLGKYSNSQFLSSTTLPGAGGHDWSVSIDASGNAYAVGAASGPTTVGIDVAVYKVAPNGGILSSATANGIFANNDYAIDSDTGPANSLWIAGAMQKTGPEDCSQVPDGTCSYAAAMWKFDMGTGVLARTTEYYGTGNNAMWHGVDVAANGDTWVIGYSSNTANPGRKLDLTLAKYNAAGNAFAAGPFNQPSYFDSMDNTDASVAVSTWAAIYAAARIRNNVVPTNGDMAVLRYDLSGATVAVKYWHSNGTNCNEKPAQLALSPLTGNLIIAGRIGDCPQGTPVVWHYNTSLDLVFAQNVSVQTRADGVAISPSNDRYLATTSTFPVLFTSGPAADGAEGLDGTAPPPLSFTFTGGPATSLKINSNNSQNEGAVQVAVDTTSAVFYLTWRSTSGSIYSQPDVAFLGKFDFSGALLASATLQGNRSGDAFLFAYGNIWLQERDTGTLRQYTKFNTALNRVGSLVLGSNSVGNITNAVAANGAIYLACDGGSTSPGAKIITMSSGLIEVSRTTNTEYGAVHHNSDGFTADAVGNLIVAISTSEAGPARSLFKYDANLAVLSSANVTGLFPNGSPQLAYGGAGVLYAMGPNAPTSQVFLRKFGSDLSYSGQTATFAVTGTATSFALNTDSDLNALLSLTSSTADGGDILAFKFNNALVQLSSGQFDAGFSGADIGVMAVAISTAEVFLTGAGGNVGHTDAVVMRRSLPAAAAVGGPLSFTFSGNFAGGGALIASNPPQLDVARHVVVDTQTAGGPFIYASFVSTTAGSPFSPYVASLVKYDAAGIKLASTTLLGNRSGDGLTIDPSGNIYVGELDTVNGTWLTKYDKNLVFASSRTFSGITTDNIADLAWDSTSGSLFAGVGGGPVVVKLSPSLVILASAPYSNGAITIEDAITVSPAGDVYVVFSSTFPNPGQTRRLVKYGNSLGSPLADTDVSNLMLDEGGALAFAGSNLYATSVDAAMNHVDFYLRKFTAGAAYTGQTATRTATAPALFGLTSIEAGADGKLYAVWGSTQAGALVFDQALNLLSSAPYAGLDLAVQSADKVYLASTQGADALVRRIDLSAAAGGPLSFTFSGNFNTGALISGPASNSDFGRQVIVDTVTVGGPFVYTEWISTTGVAPQNPHITSLVRYNASGVVLVSTTLAGTRDGPMAMDAAQNIYVAEKIQPAGTPVSSATIWLDKFDKNLVLLAQVYLDTNMVGNISDIAVNGTDIFLGVDGGMDNVPKVLKFNSGLALVSSFSYTNSDTPHTRNSTSLGLAANGDVYWVAESSVSGVAAISYRFLKLPATLSGPPVFNNNITAFVRGDDPRMAVGPSYEYVVSADTSSAFFVNAFLPSGAYAGVTSTVTGPANPGGFARVFPFVGPDGSFYVGTASDTFGVRRFDPNSLAVVSSAPFSGAPFALDPANVYLAGATGLPSSARTIRVDLSAAAVPGLVNNLTFSGSFLTGARAANSAGGADIGRRLAVMPVGLSTFVYATVHSTTGATTGVTPDQVFLAKYDLTGVMLASAALLGNHSGDVMVAEGGFLYVSEKDSPGTMRRLVKYDANLNRLNSVLVDAAGVGNITDGFARSGFLYTVNDGGSSSNGAKVIKYDALLNEVVRATYSFGANQANGNSVVVTPNGEVFVQVFSSNTTKLVKYDGNLNPLAERDVSNLYLANGENFGLAFANGVLLGAAFDAGGGNLLVVRKFDPSLNYSGASSTFSVQTAHGFGLKAGPDGLFYVALTSSSADGGNYALKVLDADLVEKASTSFDAGSAGLDHAVGVAVLDSSNVFVTGAGLIAGQYDAVTFVKNLSAAGGGAGGQGGPPGGFWGLASKNGKLWAVQRGLGVARRYDFPAPPLSRTSPFSQELGASNGLVRPTALGVDAGGGLWVSVSTAPGAEQNTRLVRYASAGSLGEVAPSTSNVLSSLLSGVHAIAFRPETGDMWVTQGGGNPSVLTYLRDGGSTLSTPTYSNAGASTFTTTAQLADADALAFDTGGNLWVTGRTLGQIRMYPKVAGSISASTGQFITALSTPGAIAFDAMGNMYVGEENEGASFSGKLWKFANQGSAGAPLISNSPVLVQSGVDPTALAFIGGQLWGTSDINDQIVSHPTEPPVPPPSFGSVAGTLSYAGVKAGTLRIAFSTDPTKVDSSLAATLSMSTPALGGFSVATLQAPNTYYVRAFRDLNNDLQPDGFEPQARLSAAFWGPLTPVFVPKDQTVTGVNLELFDAVAVTGTIINNSAQPGAVRFDAWSGAPQPSPTAARYTDDSAFFLSNPFYQVYVATVTDLHVRAYVDSNNNRRFDAGEDSGSVGPLNLSALPTGTTQLANVTIAAGVAGQLFFNAASLIGANIPTSGEAAFLKLNLWSAGGNVQLSGLRVTLKGDAPAPNVFARVYKDANGNGAFEPGADIGVGDKFFSGSVPPTAAVTFLSTQTVGASTQTYFVGLQLSGLPAGKSAGLALDSASAFTFANGSLAAGQGPFPVESALAVSQFSLAARPSDQGYPSPMGGASPSGGFDSGLFVNVGQRLEVNASGVWNTGALGATGPGGLAGQASTAAPAGTLSLGALIGRIGGSAWFLVGNSTGFVSGQSGSLALAMNDTDYNDNGGSLAVDFRIVASTATRVWLGTSGFGQGADIAQNWQGGLLPQAGENVEFNGGVSNAACDWNLYYAKVNRFEMKGGYSGRVRLVGPNNADDFNQVFVDSKVVVQSGTLDLGRNHELFVLGGVIVHGVLDMGGGNSGLGTGVGVIVEGGGAFRFTGTGFPRVFSTAFGSLGFEVLDGTVEVRGDGMTAGLRFERPRGLLLSASANILAFDGAQFDQFDTAGSTSALVLARSTAAVYTFRNLGFNNNFTKNVDASGVPAGASITLRDAAGNRRGSPFEQDPNNVLNWVPDGGGAPASIAGTVLDGGVTISGSTVIVRASTQPFFDTNAFGPGGPGMSGGLVFLSTRNGFGAYTLANLEAPATYYLYAHRESIPLNPNDFPDGSEPRGAFGQPGLLRSDPIFIASGQNLAGKDITLRNWFEATGAVNNNSQQFGTILIGAAHVNSTTTFEAISGPIFGNSFPPLASPVTSTLLIGWVDGNNNRRQDSFEAFGTFGPFVPGISTAVISIGGGSAAPGGTLFLTTTAAHIGLLGDSGPQSLLRLDVVGSVSPANLTGLKVDYTGGPNNFGLAVYKDTNGNGKLDSGAFGTGNASDLPIGSTQAVGGAGTSLINFFDRQTVNPLSTTTLFLAFDPAGLVGGHPTLPALSVSIGASNYFLFDGGQMAAPGVNPVYPAQTSAPIGWSVYAQTQGDSFGGGGYFTGVQVAAGQTAVITATGSWKFSGTPTDYRGLAGTEGQPTLASGKRVGAVLASVGNGWVAVGTGVSITASFPHGVHLSANDILGDYFNNEGFVTTNISVTGSTTSHVQGTISYEGGETGNMFVNLTQECQSSVGGAGFCNPIVATTTVVLAGGTTQYAYGLHIPFGGFFKVKASVANNGSHRSGFVASFQAPLGSTATVNFPVSSGLGAITSTISYSGIQSFGSFRVGVTTSPDLEHGAQFFGGYSSTFAGTFAISDLPIPNTYYMVGFRDGNFNQEPDGPEPFGALASVPSSQLVLSQLASVLTPIFVSSTAHVSTLVLNDRGGLSGRVFFQQAVASGEVVIAAAHGVPGSPEFAFENGERRFVQNVPAGGSVDYFLGLLKPATDYTVFAFLDLNFNDNHDSAEPFGASSGFLSVPAGGFANKDVIIAAPSAPAAVNNFGIVNFGTNFVEFRWDSAPGATAYFLLNASSVPVVALGPSATVYSEASSPASTSAITGIRASNAQGLGPITRLPAGMSNAAAAVAPTTPVLLNVAVSSLAVNWAANGNGALAKYQLERATRAAGPYQPVQYDTALSKNEQGLAPSTQYFYRVKAQSPNGGFSAPSATASATTLASADPSIAGVVSYAGSQSGSILVQAFTSSNPLAGLTNSAALPPSSQQPYYITVANGSYFLRAFVDVDADGIRDAGEDQGTFGSAVTVAGGVPQTGKDFSVAVDTVTPGSPAGLVGTSPFGRVELTWNSPQASRDGSALNDLAGFRVQRTTAGTASFLTLTNGTNLGVPNITSNAFFTDAAPVGGGVNNVYRVIAIDQGRNESIPSGAIAVKPALGGTISGSVSSFTATTAGAFRVRLSTSPRREDPFTSESTLSNFSFTGLSDGNYFLRVFRDVNADNRQDAATEPSGTHGGIVAPYPVAILNGNTVTGRVVTACDRVALQRGVYAFGDIETRDCPAADKGLGFFTDLHTFQVGGGAAGSIGVGSQVDLSMVSTFDSELIVLGPEGQVVARDNTPGNPRVHFIAQQAGLYIVEPTSFFSGQTGFYDLLLNVIGGFNATISGQTTYTGTKTGPVRLQLFDRPDSDAYPFFVQNEPSIGTFTLGGLRDGTFYLRAFRDANNNFAKDPGEPSGAYGFSESSPTAINVVGGVPNVTSAQIALADPSAGRIEGQISRQGSLPGVIRVEVGPRACNDCSDLNVVAFTTIAAAGPYVLDFLAPATNYIVQAFVDGNFNNRGDALEAKGSSSPVTVAANSTATVNVLVKDPGTGTSGSAVVFGTVTYTGSSTGTMFVAFASDQNFSFIPYYLTNSATGFFQKSGLQGGTTYFVGAFIDVNGNGTIDEDGAFIEPSGGYQGQVFVPNSSSVGVAFAISDPSNGRVSGNVIYNGAILGPLVVQAQREGLFSESEGRGHHRLVSIPRSVGVSSYAYSAGFLDAGSFRLYAFIDSNGNQRSDFGEPFFRREGLVTVSSGTGGTPATGIDLLVFDAGSGGDLGSIQGTFGYSGGQPGPVVVQLFSTNTYAGIPQRTTTGSGGPSSFSFSFDGLTAGTYFIRGFKDSNSNQVLEPQYEANGLLSGGSPVVVSNDSPFSGGHAGTLTDPGAGGGITVNSISGEVHYRGAFTTGTFHVTVFRDSPVGDDELVKRATFAFSAAPFAFTVSDLPQGQLYLRTFLDRNANFAPEIHEPFGVTDAQGISVFGAVTGLIASVCDRAPLDLTPGAQNLHTLTASSCFSRESTTLGAAHKFLTFRGARGQTFDAAAASSEDNYLYLYDQSGRLVAEADEGGSKAGDARLVTSLPVSGDYTLAAGFFSAGVSGDMRVTFQNSGGAPGTINGAVSYNGSQGGQIIAALFHSADFDAAGSFVDARELGPDRAFSFGGLSSETTYYAGAFVDVNFNRSPDEGEDFGVISDDYSVLPLVPAPIYLRSGQETSILIPITASTAPVIGEGQVTGQITYNGAETGVLRVEFWADPTFQGAPLAVRTIPTGVGPYDLSIAGGQPYFVRAFLDLNSDAVPNPNEPQGLYSPSGQGAEQVHVPSNGTRSGVDFELRDPGLCFGCTEPSGQGSATIAPAAFAAGGFIDRVTFTFVAEGRGIRQGGVVLFGMPFGFPFPQTAGAGSGYVSTRTVLNPGGMGTPLVVVSIPGQFPAVEIKVLSSTPLYAGATVQLTYERIALPCSAPDLAFFAGSASTGAVRPSPLNSGVPSVTFSQGAAASVRSAENSIGLLAGATSQRLLLESVDLCGNRVAVGANANVILRSKSLSPLTGAFADTGVLRLSSATTGVFDSTAVVTFLAGRSTASYRLRGTAGGEFFVELASNLLAPGSTGYARVSILANNTLTNVSVSTIPFQLGRTSATLVSGVNQAFINFDLGDPTRFWQVSVASTPYKLESTPEPVATFGGSGQPSRGQIAWDGRDSRGARLPKGVYYVRVDVGGLRDDSLRVTMQASELAIKVLDAGVTPNLPMSGVNVEAFGPVGGGLFATNANGELTLAGLAAGDYRLRFNKDGYLEGRANVALSSFSTISSMTAVTSVITLSSTAAQLQVRMRRAPSLVVVPSIAASSTQPYILWGSLRVENTTNNFTLSGPMRLQEGATTFDDGGQWDPSLQQFLTKTILRFNIASGTYTVRASLPGFDDLAQNVFVAPDGQTTVALPAFARRSAFTGLVFLPAGFNTSGAFVSINAVPITTTTALDQGFGGVFIQPGVATATYRIDGLKAGSYRLSANTQGLQATSIASATVFAGADTTVDFSSFPVANTTVLVATIGVTGISAVQGGFPELEPGVRLRLNVSAWAPGAQNGFYQTVDVPTIGVSSATVIFNMTGLDVGREYQVFAGLEQQSSADFAVQGGFPKLATLSTTTGRGALAFDFAAASGVIRGVIFLPPGSRDFGNVDLAGITVASARPDQVGHTFQENALALPNFVCGNGAAPIGGNCLVSTASFTVTGLNTETIDVTLVHKSSGATFKTRLSVVNGSTTTVIADLRGETFNVRGSIALNVTNPDFDTFADILANSALQGIPNGSGGAVVIDTATVDLGGAASVDSTARVLALREFQGRPGFFSPAIDRVGYLTAAGTFTLRNMPAGSYRVTTEDLRLCTTCATIVPGFTRFVAISPANTVVSTIPMSNGVSISLNIGLAGGIKDSRRFRVELRNRRQELVSVTTVTLGSLGSPSNSVFNQLTVGLGDFYTLTAFDTGDDAKYVAKPCAFPNPAQNPGGLTVTGATCDVRMVQGAFITGNLKDAASGELFNERNAKVLPPNLRITATANPWVEGGFSQAASSVSARPIRADGSFLVGPLFPDISYDLAVFQDKWDLAFLSQGSQNYAPTGVSGLKMTPLERKDVGTLSLNQGSSIKGTVTMAASTTTAIGNIKLTAKNSGRNSGVNQDVAVEGFTNAQGQFTLWVSTLISSQYDVTIAPRDGNLGADGVFYKTVELPRLKITDAAINVQLAALTASVTGQVFTADGGALSNPFSDDAPTAALFLQPVGVNPRVNQLGDITAETEADGSFAVPGLSSGVYTVRALSLGYGIALGTLTVTNTSFCLSTTSVAGACTSLTLRRGGVVQGSISLDDGISSPSTDEIGGVAAADENFTKFVVGALVVNKNNRTVTGYSITGFEPNVSYNIVFLPASREDSDVLFPEKGQGVSFSASESTTTKTVNLTYSRIIPDCAAEAVEKAVGNGQFQIKISCTEPLRKLTAADDDIDRVLSVSSCVVNGAIKNDPVDCGRILGGADKKIESDRKTITAIYRSGGDNEEKFTLKLDAFVTTKDPATGENFRLSKLFTFDTLFRKDNANEEDRVVVSNKQKDISNHQGGEVNLGESERNTNGERFSLNFGAGSFDDCDAGDTDANCSGDADKSAKNKVNVTVKGSLGASDAANRTQATLGYVPSRIQAILAREGRAFGTLAASTSTKNAFGKSPLSTFYDIFLPLGIRSQLTKPVNLTMPFDLSLSPNTPLSDVQVWSKSIGNIGKAGCIGQLCPEKDVVERNDIAKTITVSVDHFSQFVVLPGPPAIATFGTFKEDKPIAFNFPNPFDCRQRTVACNVAEGSCGAGAATGVGTMIHYAAPGAGAVVDHRFRIYNVAGEMVDEFHRTAESGANHYDFWDCTNSSGRIVASGVYILEYTVNGQSVYHKMALIKGSGL